MLLESNKIYPTYRKCKFLLMPSLEVTEGVKVYTSLKGSKPSSISEMNEDTGIKSGQINSFVTVPRWIAVTYEDEDNDEAFECGLVTSPFINVGSTNSEVEPNDIVIDGNRARLMVNGSNTEFDWE